MTRYHPCVQSETAPVGVPVAGTPAAERTAPLSPITSPALVVSLVTAAEMLDVCKRTLERERDRGNLRCLRIGGRWKVRVGELHAYLRRREIECGRA